MSPSHNPGPSEWRKLLDIAYELIDQVSETLGGHAVPWTFGGGTAMMLQIGHRESHDIDIFLNDAQFLGYFSPEKHDFNFSIIPADYGGDGARFQKFAFRNIGEIDFIVSAALTNQPYIVDEIAGRQVKLETVPEIITKKVYFRGSEAKARDIFDIAAAARTRQADIVAALSRYPAEVQATVERLNKLNPEFVLSTISQLMIKPDYREMAPDSLDIVRDVLGEALQSTDR